MSDEMIDIPLEMRRYPLRAAKEKIAELEKALHQCVEGFEYTRQYVGYETLPPITGWSWYDADKKARSLLGLPPVATTSAPQQEGE